MKQPTIFRLLASATLYQCLAASLLAQGSLTPPGPPAPTMKTLDQVEARTPISTTGLILNSPGSYYLTRNITAANTSGIEIAADNVSLDLNGFTIAASAGSSPGIVVTGNYRHIRVYNGSVRNFGTGVDLGNVVLGEVYSLVVSGCAGVGISAGDNVTVRDCVSRENGGDNFRAASHATISRCSSVLSNGYGFNVETNCHLSDCVSDSNVRGYSTGDGCSLTNCVARRNTAYGIYTEQAAIVSNCTASGQVGVGIRVGDNSSVSGCVATLNQGDGIQFTNYCLITGNNGSSNGVSGGNVASGFRSFGSYNRIDSNTAMNNYTRGITGGDQSDVIIRNTAKANAITNYSIPGSTQNVGPTGNPPSTATSPWANF